MSGKGVGLDRRRFLKAMGLGGMMAGFGSLPGFMGARGDAGAPPKRVVFLVSSHGHIWNGFKMPIPGGPTDALAQRSLLSLDRAEFNQSLEPLYDVRHNLTAIEGLAHTSVLGEQVNKTEGHDYNNHTMSYAHLLTNQKAFQPGGGAKCRGGGASIDQVLGNRTTQPGRFHALTWDLEQQVALRYHREYSYAGAGTPTAFQSDPNQAFNDLLGLYQPSLDLLDRDDRIRAARQEALLTAQNGFDRLIPKLGLEGRRKLELHRDFLADAQRAAALANPMLCEPEFASNGHTTEQFLRLATVALSCDMTRVITLAMPILTPTDFGYDASLDLHSDLAHASVKGGSREFSPMSEQAMIDYHRWYAKRIADFLSQLDSVPEAGGSMLDNTAVVWLSEMATPTHLHADVCTVIAGAGGYFNQGRYLRFPQNIQGPAKLPDTNITDPDTLAAFETHIGPSTSHLFVSLMNWMGFDDTSFGLEEVLREDGSAIDLRGPLQALRV